MPSVKGYPSTIRRYIIKNGSIIKVLKPCIQYTVMKQLEKEEYNLKYAANT
jgi:hypothetical protein